MMMVQFNKLLYKREIINNLYFKPWLSILGGQGFFITMKNILTVLIFIFITAGGFAQFSEEHIITTDAQSARYSHTADLNGDGYMDVVVASIGDNTLAWYENLNGLGNFGEKNVLSQFSVEFQFVSSGDIDGDGDLDILTTALFDDLVIWYENLDGLGSFSSRKIINSSLERPMMALSGDIDGDGDLDVICPSDLDGRITWFENTNGVGDFSTIHTITSISSTPRSVFLVDLDGDEDLDVLSDSSSVNNQPSWYENLDGLGNYGAEQVFTNDTSGTIWVIADDLDGDSDMDALTLEFGGDTIAWYENLDGLGSFGIKNIITTNVNAPFKIVTADIDNDGDQDIVSVSGADNKIAWYENDGLGNFGDQQIIALSADGPRSIDVADFDGDGYQDVVSASTFDNKVAWYQNQTYLGVDDNLLTSISLSPNPTQGLLTVNAPNTIIKSIKVFDMLGKLVLVQNNNSKTINLSKLQASLYLIKVETDIGLIIKKVVKD